MNQIEIWFGILMKHGKILQMDIPRESVDRIDRLLIIYLRSRY